MEKDPYYQETTLADLNEVVKNLGWDSEAVYIAGRISYPSPPSELVGDKLP